MNKGKVDIEKLIRFLSMSAIKDRPIPVVTREDFFIAYEKFCIDVLNDNLDLMNNNYTEWIQQWMKARSFYRHFTIKDSEDVFKIKLQKDVDLIIDIKKNGLKKPITLIKDEAYKEGFFEINGYHRLVVCKVLDYKYINYECHNGLYSIFFDRMKTYIKDLTVSDFTISGG